MAHCVPEPLFLHSTRDTLEGVHTYCLYRHVLGSSHPYGLVTALYVQCSSHTVFFMKYVLKFDIRCTRHVLSLELTFL